MSSHNKRPILFDPRSGRKFKRRLITSIVGYIVIFGYGYVVAIVLGRLGIRFGLGKFPNIVLVLSAAGGSMSIFAQLWNKYLASRPIHKPLVWLFFYEVK